MDLQAVADATSDTTLRERVDRSDADIVTLFRLDRRGVSGAIDDVVPCSKHYFLCDSKDWHCFLLPPLQTELAPPGRCNNKFWRQPRASTQSPWSIHRERQSPLGSAASIAPSGPRTPFSRFSEYSLSSVCVLLLSQRNNTQD